MALDTELERQGDFLFRHRSFLPLLTLPVFAGAFWSYDYVAHSHPRTELWQLVCLAVSLAGLAVRVITVGSAPRRTSGRNTHGQIADMLNTTGMYALVRHPLYFGNWLIWLGITLFFRSWWLVLVTSCIYMLYYERIMYAEEAFLRKRFGEGFDRWASVTPAFFPRLRGWRSPALRFCWRTALRREYSAVFAIVAVFTVFDVAGDSIAEHRFALDPTWLVLLALGGASYVALRALKRKTAVLRARDR